MALEEGRVLAAVVGGVFGKRIEMPTVSASGTEVALPPTPEDETHPDQLSLG